MNVSDPLIIANCNTLAKAAKALADNDATLKALAGENIAEAGATMCLNLIAETCHMLTMLNDWSIEIDDFFIEPSFFVLNEIVKSAKTVGTED